MNVDSKDCTLEINGLSVALPQGADRRLAIQDLSIRLAKGYTLCVVGESGSGKSVTATAIMGLLPKELAIQAGDILLRGESIVSASPTRLKQLRAKVMGMVFQEPMTALNPVMSCGDQLDELLRKHTDWSKAKRYETILAMMEQVRLPDPPRIMRSYPHQLSGGQRQRIVIAMAMILRPELLICDEPTTALDVTTQKEILRLIAELKEKHNVAVLFITHDMGVVAEIADHILVMRHGESVEYGTRDEILKAPQHEYTRQLLAAVPSMQPPARRDIDRSRTVLRGVSVSKTYASRTWTGKRSIVHALKDSDLRVHPGETVGIVGESGSGKSTFARCLVRLIDPTGGQVLWTSDTAEVDVSFKSQRQIRPYRNGVQIVFQDPNRSLNPRLKVGDALIEGAVNFGMSPSEATSLARELLKKVQLPVESLSRYPSQFSGGQRQRLAIARALACKPKVLVADEAVSALDVSVQAQIMRLLREIQSDLGLSILFITHDLRVAAQLCDRVIVMHRGEIVEEGHTDELYANPLHDYTRKLLEAAPVID
ncbi:ABC transporter ATP-binding protein [Alcaligenaceae bacterium]|nr:ABC transporter ATP-binding protein [Alcaligenaceae bacterium]